MCVCACVSVIIAHCSPGDTFCVGFFSFFFVGTNTEAILSILPGVYISKGARTW